MFGIGGSRQEHSCAKKNNNDAWSCRADAVKALVRGYKEMKEALSFISKDDEKTAKTRCNATGFV